MDNIPENPPGVPATGGDKALKDAVSVPAMLLMATGGLVILFWLINLVASLTGFGSDGREIPPEFYDNPNLAQYREFLESLMSAQSEGPNLLGALFDLVGVGLGGLIVLGGLRMMQLRAYGLAITASIIAMIPCFSCCCSVIGVPVGIWALVVLARPEVKAAFR
jgi:hypothetical protein